MWTYKWNELNNTWAGYILHVVASAYPDQACIQIILLKQVLHYIGMSSKNSKCNGWKGILQMKKQMAEKICKWYIITHLLGNQAYLTQGIDFCFALDQRLYNLQPSLGRSISQRCHFYRHFNASKIELAHLKGIHVIQLYSSIPITFFFLSEATLNCYYIHCSFMCG